MSLDASIDAAVRGDGVTFEFRVRNAGDEPVDLTFTSGKTADVVVSEADSDRKVWQWGDGRMFTQAMRYVTMAPGDEIEERYTWKNPSTGKYVVTGRLEASDADVEAETTLTV